MDNLSKLQRRKAELKAQIEQQREDLKKTFLEVREEIEPANLLKKAVSGALGFSKKKSGTGMAEGLKRLPAPVAFLVDILVRDPKWALGLKLLTPLAMKYWPGSNQSAGQASEEKPLPIDNIPPKVGIYGKLRRGISAFRSKLRRKENRAAETIE